MRKYFFTQFKMIHNLWVDELYQKQYVVDAVDDFIDKHNQNSKETPLFEFEGDDFILKMNDIENKSLSEHLQA